MRRSTFLGILCCLVLSQEVLSKPPLPRFYKSFRQPSHLDSLDYVLIEVNGESRIVRNGETINFVAGDVLLVKEGRTNNPKRSIESINIYGYRNPKRLLDDRTFQVDTAYALDNSDWAIPKGSNSYSVVASSGRVVHGTVYLKRLEPSLSHVEVRVNDKSHLMREGRSFVVNGSDKFKVEKVVTNIEDIGNVEFAMLEIPADDRTKKEGGKKYNIIFRYKNNTFAQLPMIVRNE